MKLHHAEFLSRVAVVRSFKLIGIDINLKIDHEIMYSRPIPISKQNALLIKYFDNWRVLARSMGISSALCYNWRTKGVPTSSYINLYLASGGGIEPFDLNPSLFIKIEKRPNINLIQDGGIVLNNTLLKMASIDADDAEFVLNKAINLYLYGLAGDALKKSDDKNSGFASLTNKKQQA